MDGYPLFQDALVIPHDQARDLSSESYSPCEHDDDRTLSTASSPVTPSSDISTLFPSWALLSQESEMDLSSWDATPDWVKQLSPQSYDVDGSRLSRKRRRPIDEPYDLPVAAEEPPETMVQISDAPFRFVEITPDSIVSGDIHRAKGEWKRGRPRLQKSASKTKSKARRTSTQQQHETDQDNTKPSVEVVSCDGPAAPRHEQSLFQPVFDHLLVTEQERDFFAGLFAPGLLR